MCRRGPSPQRLDFTFRAAGALKAGRIVLRVAHEICGLDQRVELAGFPGRDEDFGFDLLVKHPSGIQAEQRFGEFRLKRLSPAAE